MMSNWTRIIKRNGGMEYAWGCVRVLPGHPAIYVWVGRLRLSYNRQYRFFQFELVKG
jgi:hypothetical protein